MKYDVKYYYLSTGMEGIPDTHLEGVYEAESEEDAIQQCIDEKYNSNDSFVKSCLSAKPHYIEDQLAIQKINYERHMGELGQMIKYLTHLCGDNVEIPLDYLLKNNDCVYWKDNYETEKRIITFTTPKLCTSLDKMKIGDTIICKSN